MSKKYLVIGFVVLVVIIYFAFVADVDDEKVLVDESSVFSVVSSVNFENYNYDFVDENVKRILTSTVRDGKTAFYLPSTGYINVSRGSKFGVAFALNNPNPSGDNMFKYEWTVDDSVVNSCGVSVDEAQGWIERGWASWGKIPKGWVDHMTVYFSFPSDVEPCNVKYNFEILRDGVVYDTKTIEFNLL